MLEKSQTRICNNFFFGALRISSLGLVDDAREDRRAKLDRPGRDSESLENFYRELREKFFLFLSRVTDEKVSCLVMSKLCCQVV